MCYLIVKKNGKNEREERTVLMNSSKKILSTRTNVLYIKERGRQRNFGG